jgi:uncharacterized membrane protein HdeD (DUF308 family)
MVMTRETDPNMQPLQPIGAESKRRVAASLGHVWWSFMRRGLITGALGLCALIWPTMSLALLLRLVALYLLADGVVGLAPAFRSTERTPHLVQAAISLAVGAVLLFWPGVTIRTLLVVFGVWTLLSGIGQLFSSRQLDAAVTDRGLLTSLGVITGVVGLVLILWPGTGVVAIAWVIGAAALVIATLLIILALCLKRIARRVETLRLHR